MKPTGTEWHSHASVATDELAHTHSHIHKQKTDSDATKHKKHTVKQNI